MLFLGKMTLTSRGLCRFLVFFTGYLLFLILGASVFSAIEGPEEIEKVQHLRTIRSKFLEDHSCITGKNNLFVNRHFFIHTNFIKYWSFFNNNDNSKISDLHSWTSQKMKNNNWDIFIEWEWKTPATKKLQIIIWKINTRFTRIVNLSGFWFYEENYKYFRILVGQIFLDPSTCYIK